VSRPSPYVITLSDADRAELEARSRAYTAPRHQVLRARMVLLAADGMAHVAIAERLDVSVCTVSLWRQRFFEQGLPGLAERQRSGRPRSFSPSGAGRDDSAGLRAADSGAAGGPAAVGVTGRVSAG
jgi:Homeodomain-like domain